MKKKLSDIAEPVLTFLTVLLLGSVFVLPQGTVQRFALAAACTAMPEGGILQIQKYFAATAQTVPAQAVSVVPSGSSETPSDILRWIAEAQKAESTQKKDGDIREKTYDESSGTETFRGLCIRNMTEDVEPDYDEAWEAGPDLSIDKSKPAVLIVHTHTTEGYETLDRDWYAADVVTRTTDTNRNVARVGSAIAESLEAAGFRVLHDKTVHDTKYSGAYDRSRATIEKYLKQYPELSVVLDVHRDAIQENNGTKIKPVTKVAGKKAAQIMLIAGTQGGTGSAQSFTTWEKNFCFALRLQAACEATAPTLMRPLFFCYRKYNMDLTPCSLLVEFGSEANTLQEAVYSGRLFGRALASLLEQYVKE